MDRNSVLVVDDEPDILELVRYNLEKEGFTVETALSGEEGLERARVGKPELMVLDLMLPGMSGLEVCRCLKQEAKTKNLPIIMLSAKGEETDVIRGLELGADDYITKPFSPKILVARLRAAARRRNSALAAADSKIRIKELEMEPRKHEALLDGVPIQLTLTEFRVLHFLARQPGWVFTRYQIVDAVKGEDYPVTDRSVDVQIVGLRKKLGNFGSYIETVRGVGYRFQEV